ncbi:MAG TPA: SAM-dependent methyltransferase [Streptosporangiaceae bacterium]|nr:SAM-dependent methyltransferase [Streptosporangiaceae bacterium]
MADKAADDKTDEWFAPVPLGKEPAKIDTGVAHIARVYNYWLGGADNYAADRAGAEEVIAAFPNIRVSVRAQRAFLGRAVNYLAAEAGIRQFLDIGTGLPSANNTHEVAQRVAPECRIVYVDNDPIVLAHARALLGGTREGATAYVDADLRDTGEILKAAASVLDFAAPVAVMLVGILHCIPDRDDPYGIVAELLAGVPSGSYLVIAHPAKDINTGQVAEATARLNRLMAEEVTMRTHSEVCAFFEGLDMVEPGVAQLHRWRIGTDEQVPDASVDLPNYGGVGRKP